MTSLNNSLDGPTRLAPSSRLRRWAIAVALAGVALFDGCASLHSAADYTPKTMITLPTERTTHCIGRYLVTLPSNFELLTGGWGNIELYYGLDKNFQRVYATVKQERYTNEAFWDEVNKRRFAVRDTKNHETKGSMLLQAEQLNKVSALLRRLPDEVSAGSIKSEVHVLVGDRYVTLEQKSYSKTEVLADISYKNVDPGPAEARLKMIASKLLPYQNAERAKSGFCMQGVLFDVGQDDERATFGFRAKDVPDLDLEVDYHAVTGEPRQGLLERIREGYEDYPALRLRVAKLREGKTRFGAGPAEESLVKTTRPVQHLFGIERRSTEPRTLDQPFFSMELSTGNEYRVPLAAGQQPSQKDDDRWHYVPQDHAMVHREDNSSLSDEQVLKLWDEIVASVRKR